MGEQYNIEHLIDDRWRVVVRRNNASLGEATVLYLWYKKYYPNMEVRLTDSIGRIVKGEKR